MVFDMILEIVYLYDMDVTESVNSKFTSGGLAQMVERPLSMREVPGSMPGSSTLCSKFETDKLNFDIFCHIYVCAINILKYFQHTAYKQ